MKMNVMLFFIMAGALFVFGFMNDVNAGSWNGSVAGQITTNDDVGIGTDTPDGKMEVVSDNEGALKVTTTSDIGSSSAALQVNATDNVVGIKKGLAGMLVNYSHNGGSDDDLTVNHFASRIAMKLAGSGTSGYDVGHVAQSAALTFKANDNNPGYNYYQQNAYGFAMRAGVISHGFGTKKHYIKNVGGLQVLHHYDNSLRTISAENLYGIVVGDISQYSTRGLDVVNNAGGILINKQRDVSGDGESRINNLQGLWLNGDGAGADIVFGPNMETRLYGNAGDFIVDTAGNVGIGTSNPAYLLDIQGTQTVERMRIRNSTASQGLHLIVAANNESLIVQKENQPLHFLTNDQNAMTIDATGNVGIGTIYPDEKLVVVGKIKGTELCIAGDCKSSWPPAWSQSGSDYYFSGGNVGLGIGTPSSSNLGSYDRLLHISQTGTNQSPGIILTGDKDNTNYDWELFLDHDLPTMSFVIAEGTNKHFVIDGSGNVGIGTTTPSATLDVAGNGNFTGSVTASNITAHYQDLAEWVMTTEPLTPGTVVMIDTDKVDHVTPSYNEYNTLVAGVISPAPGIILGVEGENKAMVAHTGRVKVKVDTSYGEIKIGDLLVTSPVQGYAMKADMNKLKPGMLLGKALQPLAAGQQGEVLTLVTLQ